MVRSVSACALSVLFVAAGQGSGAARQQAQPSSAASPDTPDGDRRTLPYSPEYRACEEAGHGGTTAATDRCTPAERERWERRLTAAYQQLVRKLADAGEEPGTIKQDGGSQVDLLRASERAWIAFRDADCRSQSAGGGSIGGLIRGICELDHVIERTLVLERRLRNCDLDCR